MTRRRPWHFGHSKTSAAKLRRREEADLESLRDDEEVDEECVLESSEDPVDEILTDIKKLRDFLGKAAKQRMGLAIYTA